MFFFFSTGRKKLWSTLLWNVFCWKWANSFTVLGRLMGSCLLCQLSFYGKFDLHFTKQKKMRNVTNFRFQVLTFLIDPSRFRYPERAIVFLAICYLVVGCAFVAGLGAGDSVSCREPFPPPNRLRGLQMISTITQVILWF